MLFATVHLSYGVSDDRIPRQLKSNLWIFLVNMHMKLLLSEAFISPKCSKYCSAANSTPPDSLAGLRGPNSKARGGEGREEEGSEGEDKIFFLNFPSGYATTHMVPAICFHNACIMSMH